MLTSRIFPVAETKPVTTWSSAENNHNRQHEETNNGDELDGCEAEFSLAINGYCEYVEEQDECDDQRDPNGRLDGGQI